MFVYSEFNYLILKNANFVYSHFYPWQVKKNLQNWHILIQIA